MKRAIIYLRVSTSRQADKDFNEEGYSIPAQREACIRKAESLDAIVVEEFKDQGESARSADREDLQNMMKFVREQGNIDYVIVHKLDRFVRNRNDDAFLGIELRKYKTQLVSASENIDHTPSGQLMHGMLASFAEYYSNNLATEVKKGMSQKAKTGGTPWKVPLGYKNVPVIVDGHVVHTVEIDPERAPLIRLAFEMYATGEYSINQLCDILNAKGFKTIGNKNWAPRPLVRGTLAKLLVKSYYAGFVSYNGDIYDGRHEGIVSYELFEKVQKVMRSRACGEKQREHMHYLKSALYCGRCTSPLRITAAKASYLYYFCSARPSKKIKCRFPYIEVGHIEKGVHDYVRNLQLTDAEMETVRVAVESYLQNSEKLAAEERKRQQRRIDELTTKRSKLMEAYYAGALPTELLSSEQRQIDNELRDAKRNLDTCEVKYAEIKGVFDQALWLARNCADLYEQANDHERRRIIQGLTERIFVCEVPETGQLQVAATELANPFGDIASLAGRTVQPVSGLEATKNAQAGRSLVKSGFYADQGSEDELMVRVQGL
jgi:site-specific DNA recombinase